MILNDKNNKKQIKPGALPPQTNAHSPLLAQVLFVQYND